MLETGRLVVSDTPMLVCPVNAERGGHTLTISNMSVSKSVFLDGVTVTPQTGFELRKGEQVTLFLTVGEAVYAVCSPGDSVQLCYIKSDR